MKPKQPHPNSTPRIAAMGYVCLDLYPDLSNAPDIELIPGMLKEVGPCAAAAGGVVGNTGLALHRLGAKVKVLGKVADDPFGNATINTLKKHDPELTRHMIVDQGHSAYCFVLSPPGRDRMFLAHRGVNDQLRADDADDRFLDNVQILHFGYPPLCKGFAEQQGRELKRLFEKAKKRGIATSLDMSLPSPGSFSHSLDWNAYLRNVLPVTDIFMPSLDELLFMLKTKPGHELANTIQSSARKLTDIGAAVVMLKLGENGVYLKTSPKQEKLLFTAPLGAEPESWTDKECIAPCYQVKVEGTTGAGDATIAGFLAAAASGLNPSDAVNFATATGAASVTKLDSTSGIPTIQIIRDKINGQWSRAPFKFNPQSIPLA